MDEKTSENMISYFARLLEFYRKFLDFETEKQGYLEQDKLDRLDECMKREQAFVLKARGLEQERARLMQKTPQPQANFREIIPLFPSGSREQIQELYEKLSSVLAELKETNRRNSLLTERKLRRASGVLNRLKGRTELQKIYGRKAGDGSPSAGFLSKKI
ncbi:flagellar protein FlgN [Caproiciproducens sp. NJN-50]|uniref:flagellar protein FlgN n=1 Tax=Acutalibacteraceae TaxID=3082771 RepID=UPI000FFE12E0|nr:MULTISPECIES: flagellar protein FlgN [Acutalibacteraceae]QAT50698.1 flagellar protein FlgN [Caproiciproducens sp. NJN-50]